MTNTKPYHGWVVYAPISLKPLIRKVCPECRSRLLEGETVRAFSMTISNLFTSTFQGSLMIPVICKEANPKIDVTNTTGGDADHDIGMELLDGYMRLYAVLANNPEAWVRMAEKEDDIKKGTVKI